jgi:hypothetical protein
MKGLFLICLALGTIGLVGCDAFSVVPRAQPTAAPLPTQAPTAVPSATVSPTPTQPPATATSANPLDALKRIFGGWASVKTFRAKYTRTAGGKTTDGTLEVVLPDRYHLLSSTSEIYIIGNVFYIKTGKTWLKSSMPKDFDMSFSNWKKFLDDLGAATDIKFIGPDLLDGTPTLVYQYTVTIKGPPAISTVTKFWSAVSDNLPRKSETTASTGNKTVTTYYDYNANIVIEAPIK